MNAVIPWQSLLALIALHCPKAGRGRQQLTAVMFAAVREHLDVRRLLLRAGTIVDAAIIAAPSSTKNATQTRDPEMRQTKKGNMWHFGMKVPVGSDRRGIVPTVTTTDATQADVTQFHDLLHGGEAAVYGDQAYWCAEDRADCEAAGREVPDQPARAADPVLGRDQSGSLQGARPCGTSVSHHQTPLEVRQGAVPRVTEEHRAGLTRRSRRRNWPHAPRFSTPGSV